MVDKTREILTRQMPTRRMNSVDRENLAAKRSSDFIYSDEISPSDYSRGSRCRLRVSEREALATIRSMIKFRNQNVTPKASGTSQTNRSVLLVHGTYRNECIFHTWTNTDFLDRPGKF